MEVVKLLYNLLMVIIVHEGEKVTKEDLEKAKADYETYIKITIDIEGKIVALGGEYHADAEKLLLEGGSKQNNIWGGGVNLESRNFETNAIVNLRSGRNNSTDILDGETREKFLDLAKKVLRTYV